MKIKNVFNILVIIGFCIVIFLVPVLTKLEPHSETSIFENRKLAEPPVFSFETIFKNKEENAPSWNKALRKYMSSWDTYFSDHIVQRDKFLKLKNLIDINILKRPVVNDVVIQKDFLVPFNSYAADTSNIEGNAIKIAGRLSTLNELVKSYGGKFIYIGVPEQYSMFRDLYPKYLNNNDELLSLIESCFFSELEARGIDYINMRTEFYKTGDYKYYYSKTDHHYNLMGAFLTYQILIHKINADSNINIPMLTDGDIEFIQLNNPFYGSRNRKLYNRYDSNDKLYYYTEKNPIEFRRENNGTWVPPFVFNLPDANDETTPVTYNIYMSGDIAETIIQTKRDNLPNALLFGDSFTNPFETFLFHSFNETRSLDLRHYTKNTILNYIEEFKPEYVFCMRDDTAYLSLSGNGDIK